MFNIKHEIYQIGTLVLVTNKFQCVVFPFLNRNADYRSLSVNVIIFNKGLYSFDTDL
jgi:hypothetical protein